MPPTAITAHTVDALGGVAERHMIYRKYVVACDNKDPPAPALGGANDASCRPLPPSTFIDWCINQQDITTPENQLFNPGGMFTKKIL